MDPNQIKPKTTIVDFLLNIASIIALYTIVGSTLNLLFTVIGKAYPKITNEHYYYSQSISWPVSILIILFPIFVTIMYFLEKSYGLDSEKRNSGIHKWLTYITIFIGGIILIGDFVTVLYYFIDGQEMTTGFILKALTVLVISLAVFFYFISEVRGKLNSMSRKVWTVVTAVIILGSIVWGFSVLGSPRTQQLLKYDEQKVNNLQNLNSQVVSYYSEKGTLPNLIKDMENGNYYIQIMDPQTQKPYEYQKINNTTYNLCAEFNKASDGANQLTQPNPDNKSWKHSAGRYCFVQTINPNIYSYPNPNYPKIRTVD